MKKFHPLSFGLGLASGFLVLLLVFGGVRLMRGNRAAPGGFGSGNFQRQGANRSANMATMAQRFGMTEVQLRAELDSGKTMQQIAAEHGVDFQFRGNGNAMQRTATGGTVSSSAGFSSSQPPL